MLTTPRLRLLPTLTGRPGVGRWLAHDARGPVARWDLVWPSRIDQGRAGVEAQLTCEVEGRCRLEGLASEGAEAVLAYAFATRHLLRVFAETPADDDAARGLAERLGMRYVRAFHLCRPVEDDADPCTVEYAMTYGQWHADARSTAAQTG